MDIHRYFHPHHNPRLIHTPLRLQELSELEQAAIELKKAIVRSQIRTAQAPVGPIREEHFSDIIVALDYAIESLDTLTKAHPGDDPDLLAQMIEERRNSPGWETWSQLLRERLDINREQEEKPLKNAKAG